MPKDSRWLQALTLSERIALRHKYSGNPTLSEPVNESEKNSAEAAARHLKLWKSQPPFDQSKWFTRMLGEMGITEQEFVSILGGHISEGYLPSFKWIDSIGESFSSHTRESEAEPDPSYLDSQLHGFSTVTLPLIRNAVEKLTLGIKELTTTYPRIPFDPETITRTILAGLPRRLRGLVERVGVLELHVARLQGNLAGDTPEKRFHSFINRLKVPEVALELFREYPVLARVVLEHLDLWVESNLEFLSHLCADWSDICSTFGGGSDPGALEELDSGAGDRHRRGRSVLLIRFSSGFRLVYKPKSLIIDARLGQLLEWLHERGAPLLRLPKVLDRGAYGWAEFISPSPCYKREELARFYERQGALLALLYTLEANDCHNENLIAAGEHPVLVDLESLFHPDFGQGDPSVYRSAASFVMNDSVLRVGILPHPQQGKDERIIDRSGLGGQGEQLALRETPTWARAGTDEMHLVRRLHKLLPATNRPSLAGKEVDLIEFSQEIVNGFRTMYALLMEARNELLKEGGILESFTKAEVRSIFRLTQFYSLLLSESFHPDLLRNALERDRLFSRLWFGLDQSPLPEAAIRIIPFELNDLWRGDVPFFSTKVNSKDVWTSDGQCLPNFFRRSGWEAACCRLKRLNDDDLNRQIWFIKGSLTAFAIASEPQWTSYTISEEINIKKAEPQKLIEHACAIGDRLLETAIWGEQGVSWLGLSLIGGRHWALLPFGLDLYGGLPGIILFLAYLGWVTGNSNYTNIAIKAVSSIREELRRKEPRSKLIGGFEGWGGLLHVWTHLSTLWRRDSLLGEAAHIAESMIPLVSMDKSLDVVSGSAGGIATLLELHHISNDHDFLRLAQRMGDRLVSQAQPTGNGIGWLVPTNPTLPLTGFSHGASGIAWSLLKLHGATGNASYKEVAVKALEFERGVFIRETGNWPDLREAPSIDAGTKKFMTAWCHGATGIGLSRLGMLPWLDTPSIKEDIQSAFTTTLKTGFGSNHSLCHGDLGSLDFLLLGSQVLGEPQWKEHLELLTAQVMTSIDEFGWLCGVPLGTETPGLLCGLAGIGYELLRLALPDRVPSVLLLDPPMADGDCASLSTKLHTVEAP